MAYSGKEIVSRIKGHVRKRGGIYGKWFVGVSAEPRMLLFKKHSVRKKGDCWILIQAVSTDIARRVKTFLVERLGMVAGKEAADKAADFVYAYKKSSNTKP